MSLLDRLVDRLADRVVERLNQRAPEFTGRATLDLDRLFDRLARELDVAAHRQARRKS